MRRCRTVPALVVPALAVLALALVVLTGCRVGPLVSPPVAGAFPSPMVTNTSYPNERIDQLVPEIPYDPSNIKILGWYETEEASGGVNARFPVAGSQDIISVRDSDFASTYQQLCEENDLDGMLNMTVDTKRYILNLLVIRGTLWQTRVGGVGYQFIEDPFETNDEQPL